MSSAPGTAPLDVRGGVVAYGGRPALLGAGLRVGPGEAVAVLGANGSGKSTLVRAALGLVPLVGGEVRLFGTPLARFRQWARVGYVPQRSGAGGGVPATVGEVVAAGRLARRGFLRPASARDRAAIRAALTEVDLLDRIGDPVATLSGGQQQRTLIARALAGEPDLLVLDEPTAGIDAASQETLAGTLERATDRGAAVVVVAHELGALGDLLRRAIVLERGRVVHDGRVPAWADPRHDHALDPDHRHGHDSAAPISPAASGAGLRGVTLS